MSEEPSPDERTILRHLRAGFWGLALFVLLGAGIEVLHAYKVASYMEPAFETRRLLLRLAHAHGTLLALVNVVYALVAERRRAILAPLISTSLLLALALLPAGFFLGGLGAQGGDPGAAIALVPAGAVALIVGLVLAARRL